MSRLTLALEQIEFARGYTLEHLADAKPEDWFRMPGGVTHLAWQVGHLAIAEYRLGLMMIRGKQPADINLIPDDFLPTFGRGSVPVEDPSKYPPLEEIRRTLDRVQQQVLTENRQLTESQLDEPTGHEHRFIKTKLKSLQWCSQHEMVHAGQIGLLKRLLGHSAKW